MTNNDDLLKELSDRLLMSEDYLKRLEESKTLPDEILSKYLSDLVALQINIFLQRYVAQVS